MKPPIACSACNDIGIVRVDGKHQYCTCALGVRIQTDAGDKAQRWLERMDNSLAKRSAPASRVPSLAELEAEYYASQQPPAKEEGEQ
jgi:hypothetical protein